MGWVATAVIGGSIIGAGASIYSSGQQSDAISESTAAQSSSNAASLALQEKWLEINRADIKAAVDAGMMDLETGYNMAVQQLQPYAGGNELNTARGLLGNPSSLMDRPSNQFIRDEGYDALQAAYSRTSGGGLSGPVVKAAQQYGQNLASTLLDEELNRLFPFINLASETSSQLANLYTGGGVAKANLRATGATGVSGAAGSAVAGMSNTVQNQGRINANAAIQQSNVNTQLMSNLANIGTSTLNYAAVNPNLFSSVQSDYEINNQIR